MKNILICLFLLGTVNAFATKARMKALNSSFHLADTQSEFTSPYHMFSVKDFVSFESGVSSPTGADDGAEGLVKFSIDEQSKILLAIGHKDEAIQTMRKFLNTVAGTNFKTQQNPIELIYAMKNESIWAVGLFYSNSKDKVATNNESSLGFRLGFANGDFKWKLNLGLVNKVENVTDGTLTAQPYTNIGLRYGFESHKFGLDFTGWEAKRSSLLGTEVDSHVYQNIKFQYVETLAKDGEDFFYGIAIEAATLKNKLNDKKLNRLALPVWIGFENQASEWLIVRASIKQSLLAQAKDENGYAAGSVDGAFGIAGSDYAAEPNNTEVSTGLGLKFKNLTIDGTLKAMTGKVQTQQIDSANFLALVGITYLL